VGENRVLEGDTLQTVHRNSLRLLKLVNTLLDFSRIEAGRVQASYQSVDLAECTAELASVFRSAVEKAGMKLIVSCEPLSEPAYVDRDMWEKVVLNLLSNAFKFTLEGEIEVRLHQDRNRAFLTVRDTGTGISAEQLPHIFERFHRVEGTRARTHEGTGIGLALVQELVRLHGGSIDVESAPEVGTTFTIGLPLGKSHLPADRISATVSLSSTALRADAFVEEVLRWIPGAGDSDVQSFDVPVAPMPHDNGGIEAKRSHILLADDNADMREYVQRLLQSHYEVTAVSNGVEALKALAAQSPDLVLSDVMMPELDGFGLLQSIRGDLNTSRIPVILLSARAGEEARIEGLAAGADDYLTKPFTARDLLSRVASHLELARVRYEGEQALRESEERFRTMADTAPVLIWMAGVDTLCTYFNRPWLEFTGRSLEAEIGTGWAEGVHSDDVQQCWNTYLPAFEARKEFRIEFRLRSHSGEYRWMLGSGVPRYSPDGTFSGYIGSCMDITDRKAAEAERDRHLAEIESLNVRLQRGMTETHHRVKNNLQLMSALIDMQRTTGAETVPMSELTRLAANVRALGVIHDVLTHEVKAGSDQETLPVNTVLARLVELLDQTADRRTLIAHFDELRLAARQATTLALVTNELISNALKHGNGEVEVHLRICDDAAMLEVCDDGPGFPQDFKFETITNTGLELVKDIVVWDLAGKIDHNNRATGGARVVVTFPITPNEGEA
jgi:PAS domain S-box-containing protein